MPRGVQETSEDVLVALQDDTHNQVVAAGVMVRLRRMLSKMIQIMNPCQLFLLMTNTFQKMN
ncbi:hypothetical protein Bca52824_038519 [Brassica carinata]|uniref:Uncharacterized protein n=1 Tax=Brassica carinata TaxID=52824 RepID=A0A8X7RS08_BRACI|nr:hypothetical protein Bca52824_038519 [Brassica carinata]